MPVPFEPSTIVAAATAPARSGVGILRLSGPESLAFARTLCPDLPAKVLPRHAHLTRMTDTGGAVLDEGLLLHFPSPHSYTGEDVVELQLHGSPHVLEMLTDALVALGALPAEPGAFTRRAFLNGRMDLARAEAVADLIAAESDAAVRASAAQLRGALGSELSRIQAPLLELRADLEGVLEFPDEADGAEADADARIIEAMREVSALLATAERGALLRTGARVVLYGPVNAGKSTLFNRLVGVDRALVDAEPGTTRDVLESRLELGGIAVTLVDTAGLRDAAGRLESLGIERARDAVAASNIAVLVVPPDASATDIDAWMAAAPSSSRLLRVVGKSDLAAASSDNSGWLRVSGQSGAGIEALRSEMVRALGGEGVAGATASVSERHAALLRKAHEALTNAQLAIRASTLEVVAGELALCLEALADITGENASEALLDAVFARFCIGK